jgi:hypothetical protein
MSFDDRINGIEKGVSRYNNMFKFKANFDSKPSVSDLKIGAGVVILSFVAMYMFLSKNKLTIGAYSVCLGILAVVAWKAWKAYKKKNQP